jgi:hypothetical protein
MSLPGAFQHSPGIFPEQIGGIFRTVFLANPLVAFGQQGRAMKLVVTVGGYEVSHLVF